MSAARTFRSIPFGVPNISQRSLGIPTAAYPGRIATNADLIVAVDRQQTSLALSLTSSATSMTVTDPSLIVAFSLLSIDNELVQTTGAPVGNIVPISRGFDGTTPAVHLLGATVSGMVDAWHHNALVAEVEAIENALGPNLSRIPSSPVIVSSAYDFPAQSPGGTLNPGSQVVTLSPVPLGVNGSDAHHWLYISGGTGAAEAVLITGGTAVSGAPSGTVIVTIGPGGHSGAFTIKSAAAGIREAIIAGGMACQVCIPYGTHTIYATIWSEFGASIHGQGGYNTVITPGAQNIDAFHLLGASGIAGEIGDLRIAYAATSVTTCQHGAGIIIDTGYLDQVNNVEVNGFDNGIQIINSAGPYLVNVDLRLVAVTGLSLNPSGTGQSGVTAVNLFIQGWGPTAGLTIGVLLQGVVAGSLFSNIYIDQVPVCWRASPGPSTGNGVINEIQATNVQLDGFGTIGLWLQGTRTSSNGGISHIYTNWRIAGTGGVGVEIDSAFSAIQLNNFWVNVPTEGIDIRGARNVAINGANVIQANGNVANNAVTIEADTDGSVASNIYIANSQLGKDPYGATAPNAYEFGIKTDTGAHGNITVSNCDIYGYGNPLVLEATGPAGTIYKFQGNTFSGAPNVNAAGGSAIAQFINNNGADLAVASVSSIASSTIALPATSENTVIVSADGSGGVSTITAPNGTQWVGRAVRIISTHANGIVFNTAGNIRPAKTLTTGQNVLATWDGTKWDI